MTTSSTETTRGWTDIRNVGPALMILFGLVLVFGPLASIGASGSVGNAGIQFPKCEPGTLSCDEPPATIPPTFTTAAPTTAAPTTAAPTTAAPTTAAQSGDASAPVPAAPSAGEDAPVAVEDSGAEVLGLTDAPAPRSNDPVVASADAEERSELAFTGPDDGTAIASGIGALLVAGGVALLFVSRRRSL